MWLKLYFALELLVIVSSFSTHRHRKKELPSVDESQEPDSINSNVVPVPEQQSDVPRIGKGSRMVDELGLSKLRLGAIENAENLAAMTEKLIALRNMAMKVHTGEPLGDSTDVSDSKELAGSNSSNPGSSIDSGPEDILPGPGIDGMFPESIAMDTMQGDTIPGIDGIAVGPDHMIPESSGIGSDGTRNGANDIGTGPNDSTVSGPDGLSPKAPDLDDIALDTTSPDHDASNPEQDDRGRDESTEDANDPNIKSYGPDYPTPSVFYPPDCDPNDPNGCPIDLNEGPAVGVPMENVGVADHDLNEGKPNVEPNPKPGAPEISPFLPDGSLNKDYFDSFGNPKS